MLSKLTSLFTGQGLLTQVPLIIIMAATVALGIYVSSGLKERDRLREEVAVLQASKAELESAVAVARQNFLENIKVIEARRETSSQALDESKKELSKLNETNQEVCSWTGGDVPDGVWEWLCGDKTMPSPKSGPASGSVPDVNPGAPAQRPR
ncbi:MAG: hypothetical protein LBT47_01140 [Deltaproteobacteria bacterium]|jgi:hypothetical protein|nr:hypothetical protein [Deltaproteobacteria bacterium]